MEHTERKVCVECKRNEATYWDKSYCETCYIEVLNNPKTQQLKPMPYPKTYQ